MKEILWCGWDCEISNYDPLKVTKNLIL